MAFHPVASGKVRRYFDWSNFIDPFKVPVGIVQARNILARIRPEVIVSSGGYVSIPTVLAAKTLGIPVVLYEPNARPGLANKTVARFAETVCLGFPDIRNVYAKNKTIITGHPVRTSVLHGSKEKGLALALFHGAVPTVLVMGGSQGAQYLNDIVRRNLHQLITFCQLIHICGKGNRRRDLEGMEKYVQFEYMHTELADIYATTTLAISRAGANSLAEFAANKIPSILIPLPTSANHHQDANANVFGQKGASIVLKQGAVDDAAFVEVVRGLLGDKVKLTTMKEYASRLYVPDAAKKIVAVVRKCGQQAR